MRIPMKTFSRICLILFVFCTFSFLSPAASVKSEDSISNCRQITSNTIKPVDAASQPSRPVVGAYYYLRVIWYMYFDAADDKSVFQAQLDTRLVLSLNGIAVLALGIAPGWLLTLCIEVLG